MGVHALYRNLIDLLSISPLARALIWRFVSVKKNFQFYRCGQVDGHQRMAGNEEVIQPNYILNVTQHVTKPRDQPRQWKDGANFRSMAKQSNTPYSLSKSRALLYF